MRITVTVINETPLHSYLSVWVNGGLITKPAGICLRNEEVEAFTRRLDGREIAESVAAEREACAVLAWPWTKPQVPATSAEAWSDAEAEDIAHRIRKRGDGT